MRLITCPLIQVLIIMALFSSAFAFAAPKKVLPEPSNYCAAYLVAEAKSGNILESLEPDQPRPPASMVKLMTAYVALKAIKEGNLKLDDQVAISALASKVGGSQVYLKEGESFSVHELLQALLIQSGNDAALALAQHIAGTRDSFVETMNQDGLSLGMASAEFHSPHGLPPAADQQADLMSPKDLLALAMALINDYPEVLNITRQQVAPFRNGSFEMRNHNGLLRTFEGTDGLKTGFYSDAGFCVTTTAERKGMRLIAILMGCPSRKIRDEEASALLSKAFARYKNLSVIKTGEMIGDGMPVSGGVKGHTALFAKDDVLITIKNGEEKTVERKVTPCMILAAPVAKGTSCGNIQFIQNGQVLGQSELVVNEDIAQAGLFQRALSKIGF